MKTIAYDPQREIITALLVLLISFTVLTTVRAQGEQVNYEGMKNESIPHNKNAKPSADKIVIESSAAQVDLTDKIKSWISEGSYWSKDAPKNSTEAELSYRIKKWMTNGSYWSSFDTRGNDTQAIASYEREKLLQDLMASDGK